MSFIYPNPNLTSGNILTDLSIYVNSVTNNMFWSIMLFFILIVTFFIFRRTTNPDKSLLTSGAITGVIGLFLSLPGLVSQDVVLFIWFGVGLGALWVYYNDR